MRYLVLLALACGSGRTGDAPTLSLEVENRGPGGWYSLGIVGMGFDAGLVYRDTAGLNWTWWAASGHLEPGDSRWSGPLSAEAGLVLPLVVGDTPELPADGGCATSLVMPDAGLLVRAVYRSDSDGGPGHHNVSCEFITSTP